MSGQPCAAPTSYYHGDYTNSPPYGTGTMTACTVSKAHLHLVGPWQGGPDKGHFDIALGVGLKASQHTSDGSFIADNFVAYTYSGTFASRFPGDGCCAAGGGGTPPIAFVPPATSWGVPTASTQLMAGLGAEVVSPPLAKGQDSASATVVGTRLGKTGVELAVLERNQIAKCIGAGIAAAIEKETIPVYVIFDYTTGEKKVVMREISQTPEKAAAKFFLAMILCLDDLKHEPASHHAADVASAAGCPVLGGRVKIRELDTRRVRYAPEGSGRVPGLTTTCTRGPNRPHDPAAQSWQGPAQPVRSAPRVGSLRSTRHRDRDRTGDVRKRGRSILDRQLEHGLRRHAPEPVG
jgi:hypothetical protein